MGLNTVNEQDLEFVVPLELMRSIVGYLGKQPFNEVVQLMGEINQLKPIEREHTMTNGAEQPQVLNG